MFSGFVKVGNWKGNMRIKKIISVLFFVLIGIIAIHYYIKYKERFYLITTVSMSYVLVISFLIIIMIFSYGLQLRILLNHYKLNLDYLQCLSLSRASALFNLVLPFLGGASFKAIYLKKYHNFNYSSFVASMGVANILHLMVNSVCAMILIGIAGRSILLFSIASIIFSVSLLFFLFGHKLSKLHFVSLRYLENIIDEWQRIRKDVKTLAKLFFLSTFNLAIIGFNTYVSFIAFSINISLVTSWTIAAFTTITGLMNLIPGNFGIREAIIIAISSMSGIGINEGAHAAALGRILSLIWTLLLTPFSHIIFLGKKEESTF
jgi:uncharacterized protein (TIRG00374 family)